MVVGGCGVLWVAVGGSGGLWVAVESCGWFQLVAGGCGWLVNSEWLGGCDFVAVSVLSEGSVCWLLLARELVNILCAQVLVSCT